MAAHSFWWWWDKQVEGLENSDVSFWMFLRSFSTVVPRQGGIGSGLLQAAQRRSLFLGHIGNDRSGFFGPAVQTGLGQLTVQEVSRGKKPSESMRKSPIT